MSGKNWYKHVTHYAEIKCTRNKKGVETNDISKVNCKWCLDNILNPVSRYIVGFNDKYIRRDYTYTKDARDKNLLRFASTRAANKHMDDHISDCIREERPFIHYNFVKRAA
jgi:hypothetical protein